jgi:hypothetical protein
LSPAAATRPIEPVSPNGAHVGDLDGEVFGGRRSARRERTAAAKLAKQ